MVVTIEFPELFPDAMERLAAAQHDIWALWMKYLFSVSQANADGSVMIPADQVKRWRRQIETPYSELTELEKVSDRNIADLAIDALFVPNDKGSYQRKEGEPE